MFEPFTVRARQIVVVAQEESRRLGHDHIGTEHLLLGLLRDEDGVAARTLIMVGVDLSGARHAVEEIIGTGPSATAGHIPFTPPAKKVLELAARESLQLGHNYVGTEHVLLGLIREGEGVGSQVLSKLGADEHRVRQAVIQHLAGPEYEPEVRVEAGFAGYWVPELPQPISGYSPTGAAGSRDRRALALLGLLTLVGAVVADTGSVLFDVGVVAAILSVLISTLWLVLPVYDVGWGRLSKFERVPNYLALGTAAVSFLASAI